MNYFEIISIILFNFTSDIQGNYRVGGNEMNLRKFVHFVTLNHGVEGSSPSGPTTCFQIPHAMWDFLFWEIDGG